MVMPRIAIEKRHRYVPRQFRVTDTQCVKTVKRAVRLHSQPRQNYQNEPSQQQNSHYLLVANVMRLLNPFGRCLCICLCLSVCLYVLFVL